MQTTRSPRAAPNRYSAQAAALASFSTVTGSPIRPRSASLQRLVPPGQVRARTARWRRSLAIQPAAPMPTATTSYRSASSATQPAIASSVPATSPGVGRRTSAEHAAVLVDHAGGDLGAADVDPDREAHGSSSSGIVAAPAGRVAASAARAPAPAACGPGVERGGECAAPRRPRSGPRPARSATSGSPQRGDGPAERAPLALGRVRLRHVAPPSPGPPRPAPAPPRRAAGRPGRVPPGATRPCPSAGHDPHCARPAAARTSSPGATDRVIGPPPGARARGRAGTGPGPRRPRPTRRPRRSGAAPAAATEPAQLVADGHHQLVAGPGQPDLRPAAAYGKGTRQLVPDPAGVTARLGARPARAPAGRPARRRPRRARAARPARPAPTAGTAPPHRHVDASAASARPAPAAAPTAPRPTGRPSGGSTRLAITESTAYPCSASAVSAARRRRRRRPGEDRPRAGPRQPRAGRRPAGQRRLQRAHRRRRTRDRCTTRVCSGHSRSTVRRSEPSESSASSGGPSSSTASQFPASARSRAVEQGQQLGRSGRQRELGRGDRGPAGLEARAAPSTVQHRAARRPGPGPAQPARRARRTRPAAPWPTARPARRSPPRRWSCRPRPVPRTAQPRNAVSPRRAS